MGSDTLLACQDDRTTAIWRAHSQGKGGDGSLAPAKWREWVARAAKSSNFSKEARNPDFYVKTPHFESAMNSNVFQHHVSQLNTAER